MYQPSENNEKLMAEKHLEKMRQSVEKFLREAENGGPYSEDTVAILDDLKKARKGLKVNFINY